MTEPHDSFAITATCVDCGWSTGSWNIHQVERDMQEHTTRTTPGYPSVTHEDPT